MSMDVTAWYMGDPAARYARDPSPKESAEAARDGHARRHKDNRSIKQMAEDLAVNGEVHHMTRNSAGRLRSAIWNKGGRASVRLQIGGTYSLRRTK